MARETHALAVQTSRATTFERLREQRLARPVIIARIKNIATSHPQLIPELHVVVTNKGAIAYRVAVSGIDGSGQFSSGADNFHQVIDAADHDVVTKLTTGASNNLYAHKIRIRYYDGFGNKYMTEYRPLGATLAFPIFRLPWLGQEIQEPRPRRWSEQVTWPVEHYERLPGVFDEELDPVPEDES